MVAQRPVTVARDMDCVVDISSDKVFYLMMVRVRLNKSPEEMRGRGDRKRVEQTLGIKSTSTTPLIFWMRPEMEKSTNCPIIPHYSEIFLFLPCSGQHQWQSIWTQSNQHLPRSPWSALDTLDFNIPQSLSLRESWALRIFAATRITFSSSSLCSQGLHENQEALATFRRKNCILMCKHARIFMYSKSNFSCKKLHYKMFT